MIKNQHVRYGIFIGLVIVSFWILFLGYPKLLDGQEKPEPWFVEVFEERDDLQFWEYIYQDVYHYEELVYTPSDTEEVTKIWFVAHDQGILSTIEEYPDMGRFLQLTHKSGNQEGRDEIISVLKEKENMDEDDISWAFYMFSLEIGLLSEDQQLSVGSLPSDSTSAQSVRVPVRPEEDDYESLPGFHLEVGKDDEGMYVKDGVGQVARVVDYISAGDQAVYIVDKFLFHKPVKETEYLSSYESTEEMTIDNQDYFSFLNDKTSQENTGDLSSLGTEMFDFLEPSAPAEDENDRHGQGEYFLIMLMGSVGVTVLGGLAVMAKMVWK